MARFVGIPALPEQGPTEEEQLFLSAVAENLQLLTGSRGESDGASVAITKGSLSVSTPPAQTMTNVSARGYGVTISNVQVPTLSDYVALVQDVQALANDVVRLRATVETLISQLRG